MRLPISAATTAVALTAVVTLGQASPGFAQTVRDHDARGDVVHVDGPEASGTPTHRPTVDMLGYRVRYSEKRLSVTIHYVDLKRESQQFAARLSVSGISGKKHGILVSVLATPDDRDGRTTVEPTLKPGKHCPVNHEIDYRHDVVRFDFPATCTRRGDYLYADLSSTVNGPDRNVLDYDATGQFSIDRG